MTPQKNNDLFADLFADPTEDENIEASTTGDVKDTKADEPETVSSLTRRIRYTLEGTIGRVWLEGEISNFRPHHSKHFYFSLKDEDAQISAVMFRSRADRVKFVPEDGMKVIVRGQVSVYPPHGKYQVICDAMEPHGIGALQKAFEQLKEKLAIEGLFDESRKKDLPVFPRTIGVITSPTGAAIRDIIDVLFRRFPHCQMILNPTPVQGDHAAPRIAQAIEEFNEVNAQHNENPETHPLHIDVIIAGRGGGSIEDLWPFNEECVARAIAASEIPVISAVGHETDWTIADFVADMRAPTPSAAAEIVVTPRTEWLSRIHHDLRRLRHAFIPHFRQLQQRVKTLHTHYALREPQRYVQDVRQKVDELHIQLQRAMNDTLSEAKTRTRDAHHILRAAHRIFTAQLRHNYQQFISHTKSLQRVSRHIVQTRTETIDHLLHALENVGPTSVVRRGYSITWDDAQNTPVTSINQVKKKMLLRTELRDGTAVSRVEEIKLLSEKDI